MDLSKVTNMVFEDVNDYSDFANAWCSAADYDGEPMNEEMLDVLNEYHNDFIQESLLLNH